MHDKGATEAESNKNGKIYVGKASIFLETKLSNYMKIIKPNGPRNKFIKTLSQKYCYRRQEEDVIKIQVNIKLTIMSIMGGGGSAILYSL